MEKNMENEMDTAFMLGLPYRNYPSGSRVERLWYMEFRSSQL